MNCVTVIQTSQGLAQHLIETRPNAQKDGVVIGFDGRRDSRYVDSKRI
jgi:phosphomannomutase